MKVLILSCHTGEGHNSAAFAVRDALLAEGHECEIKDPIEFASEKAKNAVSGTYNTIIQKAPKAFGVIYKAGEIYNSTGLKSPVYFANTLYAKTLNGYIEANSFNAVICTHLYAMEAMTYIRKRLESHIACYGILTDYTCIPFLDETQLDCYFIPHADLLPALAEKGIPESALLATGIPVAAKFRVHTEKDEARRLLDIPEGKKVYLIMTGGMGCGNITDICDELLRYEKNDFSAFVLTGRNDVLKSELDKRYSAGKRICAVAFTEKVNLYMNAADVMISKPGGLSCTEAAVANIPLVHLISIPGCEVKNADFFEAHGMSMRAATAESAVHTAHLLVYDVSLCDKMRRMQCEQINPDAAYDIVKRVADYEC